MSELSTEMAKRFSEWQRGLVWIRKQHQRASKAEQEVRRGRVIERQKELLEAVSRGCRPLSSYLRRELQVPADDVFKAPQLPRTLIGAEIREPPIDLELELGGHWRSAIDPALAALPLFWVRCYVEWLDDESVDGDLLSSLTLGGRADYQGHGEDAHLIRQEAQTRNFLRRLCGIPVVRFNVSVLSDCTLSRAWWRFRIAKITEENCESRVSAHEVHRVLHTNNQAWEELVRLAVRRITAINQPRALAGIVAHFAVNGDFSRERVKVFAQNIARNSFTYSIEHIPWKKLQALVTSTD